jgi:predicted nucleic acid-binding protein
VTAAAVVVFDANVLYGNEVRDLLIRVARSGLLRAHWTNAILDEVTRNLRVKRDIPADRLSVLRERMNAAVPGVLVEGYEGLIDGLKLPDPDDRHVLAAAIKVGADVVVTWNLKDFPADVLALHCVEAQTPDDLVLDLIDLDEGIVRDCVHQIAAGRTRPPKTYSTILDALERAGLIESAAALRD